MTPLARCLSRGLWLVIALLISALTTLSPWRAEISFATEDRAFCRNQIIYDYERPLRNLPIHHRIPSDGALPFAPQDIEIYRTGFNRVIGQGGVFGYRFAISRPTFRSGALRHPLTLNWKVTTRLQQIDKAGRTTRIISTRYRKLRQVRYAKQLEFMVSAGIGMYRLDLAFERIDGRKLGRYSEYFRVVPIRVNVRLEVNGNYFHPGETVFSRIDNYGTDMLLVSGEAPLSGVERYEDGTWSEVSEESNVPVIGVEEFILGGYAGSCLGFKIPPNAPLGLYRFARHVNPFGPYRSRLLTAEFSIQP